MDMMGKALVKNQVSSITKTIGLSGEEKKEDEPYDYKREQDEEDRAAREKAKRDEAQLKKKAERAVERNKMREKYGLKESKTDQKLLDSRDQLGKSSSSSSAKDTGKGKGKDENSCVVM
ncbi:complexin-4-like [Patiria miniata]|uniref:Complexin n=1 Tax=Patiria miniata TaxID=46514 RepID=A0A914A3H7_PATMI|nr:complexin-4-like [Patiria miniata]XP_038058226.1 complexin-4-like [Patiria miniata]XP_038058227.1 complexin-4-like [Patiria miniata]